jgi:hypothetical protein
MVDAGLGDELRSASECYQATEEEASGLRTTGIQASDLVLRASSSSPHYTLGQCLKI